MDAYQPRDKGQPINSALALPDAKTMELYISLIREGAVFDLLNNPDPKIDEAGVSGNFLDARSKYKQATVLIPAYQQAWAALINLYTNEIHKNHLPKLKEMLEVQKARIEEQVAAQGVTIHGQFLDDVVVDDSAYDYS